MLPLNFKILVIDRELMILFLLFTIDYTCKCCGVVATFSNFPCNVLFQVLGQGRVMLFFTEICAQSCAKSDDNTEMHHVKFFTSVL